MSMGKPTHAHMHYGEAAKRVQHFKQTIQRYNAGDELKTKTKILDRASALC